LGTCSAPTQLEPAQRVHGADVVHLAVLWALGGSNKASLSAVRSFVGRLGRPMGAPADRLWRSVRESAVCPWLAHTRAQHLWQAPQGHSKMQPPRRLRSLDPRRMQNAVETLTSRYPKFLAPLPV